MIVARTSLLLAGVLLLSSRFLALAQPAPNQPICSLLANVLAPNGNAVRDLTKDNFRVKVNAHPAAILDARYSLAPRRIVVLLDISGSMVGETGNQKWQIARKALEDLLVEKPTDMEVALLTFSSQVRDVFDFSQDKSSITAWLKRDSQSHFKVHGTTALYDAVAAAAKVLEPAQPGDAIYAITDGGDNSSRISERNTKRRLMQSQIRFFVFLLDEPTPIPVEESGREFARELARDSGGFVFGLSAHHSAALARFPSRAVEYDYDERTRESIKLQTRALNVRVNAFYTLELNTPSWLGKSNKVSLEVVDGSGKVREDIAWTYQRALPIQGK